MKSVVFLQNDVESLLPELFLALAILVVLLHGAFMVIPATSLSTLLTPSLSRLTSLALIFTSALVLNNPLLGQSICHSAFVLDALGNTAKFLSLLALLACVVLGQNYLESTGISAYEVFVLILIASLSLCFLLSSYDLLSVYLSLEMLSLVFYTLACLKRDSAFSTEAALKYFILGALASAFFLFGSSLIYAYMGTTNFAQLALLSQDLEPRPLIVNLGIVFVASTFFFKLGGAPFHMWVPDVYEGAPTSFSQVFAVVPKLSLLVVLSRFFYTAFWSFSPTWEILLLLCGAMSLYIGCMGGLAQTKLKRLLAYSGISHVGFMCAAMSTGCLEGNQGVFFYAFLYMLTTIYLWTYAMHLEPARRGLLTLVDSIGVFQANPVLALTTVLVLFSLAGIPPLGGFFAKLNVFVSLIESSYYLVALIAVVCSVISTFYYIRMVKILYFEKAYTWGFFPPMSKVKGGLMGLCAGLLIFFLLGPNLFYYLSYKMSLSLFA
uniref:Nad2 n=1 Tax=Schizocladia ischiensis TaxID=196139 RepID=A0A7S6UA41_9STRA|nr:Nad2 [Schizocladia ischiensis]QOW07601.1 Nad2 [Schizocladia ischiensis]